MDRKQEFARRVKAIEDAYAADEYATLRRESSALLEEVVALRQRLASGDGRAISEALDLLEIRRPAFGVGYVQEKLARSLKKATLDGSHLARLEFLAAQLVTSTLQGGQLREVVRLLKGRESKGFRGQLEELRTTGNVSARRRAARVLLVLEGATRGRRASSASRASSRNPGK